MPNEDRFLPLKPSERVPRPLVQQDKLKRFEYTQKWRPNWPTVMAEGDSWFDYPLADDVVDHIGGVSFRYSAFCLAEKGDKLEEIVKSGEWFPRLQEINPQVFLFSGGGNDLIKTYLDDILHDRNDVQTLDEALNQDLFDEALAELREMYRAMVIATHAMRPDMPILGHGYDYIIPNGKGAELLNVEVAGPWVKPIMIGKNIHELEDRKTLMKEVMNQFNGMLQDLADNELSDQNYTYIDCRNTLDEDDWKDEIHPNTEGFKKIAVKFLDHIKL